MSTLKILHYIVPEARFSIPKGRKSLKARNNYAEKLSKNFQKELLALPEKKLSFDTYKNIIMKTLGKKDLNIDIREPRSINAIAAIRPQLKLYESTSPKYDAFLYYEGFTLLANKENDKIAIDKSSLVHETRHLFDMICNPKMMISRNVENANNDKIFKQHEEILNFVRDDEQYKPKKIIGIFKIPSFEKELREKLTGLENSIVVSILQQCRYHLKTERNAYKDYEKFFLKENIKHPLALFTVLDFHIKNEHKFNFQEKERVLKKLIRELAKNNI